MDYDYVKFDEMIHRHLDEMWRDEERLEIGENISNIPEIKIIFDGYADLEDEDENGEYRYTEGGNKNMESYAIFIHKDSAKEGFEFPEHDNAWNMIIHRPKEEICIYAWYNVEDDEWEINGLYETSDHEMTDEEVMTILQTLDERYFSE
jgi:hypothetical protein